jgi:putative exosortase-associated protein (TIGR04073 family)
MKVILKGLPILLVIFFSIPHVAFAEGTQTEKVAEDTYLEKAGGKLLIGIANVTTSVGEIPKSIIIVSRAKGPLYGTPVGFMSGIRHLMERTFFGGLDLVTFMIPTKPLINPDYIWNHFETETTYTQTGNFTE